MLSNANYKPMEQKIKGPHRSAIHTNWLWLIASFAIIVASYMVWNFSEYHSNNAQVIVDDINQPIAVLPNKYNTGPILNLGDSINFLIDTGHPLSFISKENAKRLKASSPKPTMGFIADVNGQSKLFFGKVKIEDITLTEGVYLKNAEFYLSENKNIVGMDILNKCTLIFNRVNDNNDTILVQLLPARPVEYSYKFLDLHDNSGYSRDKFSIRRYVDLLFNGTPERYFMDTGGEPFKMAAKDSIRILEIKWSDIYVYGSNNSMVKSLHGNFKMYYEYTKSGITEVRDSEGSLFDYITNSALNPAMFFPFSIAIDFPNNAIYTKNDIKDFKLSTMTLD